MLIFGVIYPALVIAFELATRRCAQTFFDPMPTYWHVLAVGFVPASNLAVWMHLRNGSAAKRQIAGIRQWGCDRHCGLLCAAVSAAPALGG